ncbi:MAG: prepilin-type N-terminal cleavage/methylation domain-containing protein [Coprobacillus sp.]
MSKLKNNRGFTLIEVMVVIVIMAVLMAVAVPSVMKYLSTGDEAKALDEAYACVSAGDYYGTRLYTLGEKPETKPNIREAILKKAQVDGSIKEATFVDYKISRFVYKSPNGLTVLFEYDKYSIVNDDGGIPSSVVDMMYALKNIETEYNLQSVPNNNSSHPTSPGRTYRLQEEYLKLYNNTYPSLTQEEIDLMIKQGKYSGTDPKELAWKPLYTADGTIALFADQQPTARNALAPMIYYNGKYYVHKSKWGNITAKSTNEAALIIKDGAPYDPSENDDWILAV